MYNEDRLTLTDIAESYVQDILNAGYAKTKKDAKNLFIEALSRQLVSNEVLEMCHHIADPDGFWETMEGEE